MSPQPSEPILGTEIVRRPRAEVPRAPLWVIASWAAPVAGILGNMMAPHHTPGRLGEIEQMLLAIFWSLFVIAGGVLGVASIIGGFVKRRPRWALHGVLGLGLCGLLVLWALVALKRLYGA